MDNYRRDSGNGNYVYQTMGPRQWKLCLSDNGTQTMETMLINCRRHTITCIYQINTDFR